MYTDIPHWVMPVHHRLASLRHFAAIVIGRNTGARDIQDNVFFEPSLSDPQATPRNVFDLADISTPGRPGRPNATDLAAADGAAPVTGGPRGADAQLPPSEAELPTATAEG
jgi:hypothetical protein